MDDVPEPVDLARIPGDGGVVWSWSPGDCHVNLVVLAPGQAIGSHRNDALDVLVVVLDGALDVTVDGVAHAVAAGSALVVPKGTTRSIAPSGAAPARYLSVHGARPGPTIGSRPTPPPPPPSTTE